MCEGVEMGDVPNGTGALQLSRKICQRISAILHGCSVTHRYISLIMQSRKGRDGRSSKSGRRSEPMTESSSACAFAKGSGYKVQAKKNAARMAVVCFARERQSFSGKTQRWLPTVSVAAEIVSGVVPFISIFNPREDRFAPTCI